MWTSSHSSQAVTRCHRLTAAGSHVDHGGGATHRGLAPLVNTGGILVLREFQILG